MSTVPGLPVAEAGHRSSIPTLFARLIDDAALFPPGNAPMDVALGEHAAHRRAPYAELVGPFLCPASRLPQLRTQLPADASLAISLVLDQPDEAAFRALAEVADDFRLTLAMVEAPHALLGEDAAAVGAALAGRPGVRSYLEVLPAWDRTLAEVADLGWYGVKFRTGGTRREAFPSEVELAQFLLGCVSRRQPFKLTAGLHSATRHTAGATGFEHHGVLNVLAALDAASRGGGVETVAAVLADRDGPGLARRLQTLSVADAAQIRDLWRSFGCCGVTDPIEDLAALGLIPGWSAEGAA